MLHSYKDCAYRPHQLLETNRVVVVIVVVDDNNNDGDDHGDDDDDDDCDEMIFFRSASSGKNYVYQWKYSVMEMMRFRAAVKLFTHIRHTGHYRSMHPVHIHTCSRSLHSPTACMWNYLGMDCSCTALHKALQGKNEGYF